MPLRITQQDQHRILQWAAERTGTEGPWPRGTSAVAVVDEWNALRAALVVVRLYAREADLHLASDGSRRWAAPSLIAAGLSYVFWGLGAPLARAVIDADNTDALVAALRCGFRIDGVSRRAGPTGKDGVILTMREEDAHLLARYGGDDGRW